VRRVRQTHHYWKLQWDRDKFPLEWDQKTREIIGVKEEKISLDQRWREVELES